jgi:hypothetical protein
MIVFTITKFMLFRDYFVTNEEKNQKYSIYGVVEENRFTRKTFPVNVDSGKITVLILVANLLQSKSSLQAIMSVWSGSGLILVI